MRNSRYMGILGLGLSFGITPALAGSGEPGTNSLSSRLLSSTAVGSGCGAWPLVTGVDQRTNPVTNHRIGSRAGVRQQLLVR